MPVPTLTEEQRKAAIGKAIESRRKRAALREAVKAGDVAVVDVLASDEEYVKRTKVSQLIGFVPGFGKARVAKAMEELGIAESRRVGGLGSTQRRELLAYLDRRQGR